MTQDSASAGPQFPSEGRFDSRARIAVDLGAESCRVSLLRWVDGRPVIALVHRIANGPIHHEGGMRWPLEAIVAGVESGLAKAAEAAPEGVASIAVDGWAVDYVRLNKAGEPLSSPYCYRDERTIQSKHDADGMADPGWLFRRAGAYPQRINTIYQLLADQAAGVDPSAPWICLPEYVLHRLGARRVSEYTNATHTGLVDLETGDWSESIAARLGICRDAFPPIVKAGTVVGKLQGALTRLNAFRGTDLIAPACHDTASAIAGIPCSLDGVAYICSGTWSLVGTLVDAPVTTDEALAAGFTNLGAAGGKFCFHTNVNGMWILKQCLESWAQAGRAWNLPELIAEASRCEGIPGVVPVDAPSLMLSGAMPARLNEQLRLAGCGEISDVAGCEPMFARVIFESLAQQYAAMLRNLEKLLGRKLHRIHLLGGGSLNELLTRLTSERTGLPVERGNVESSTMGNFAVQLASTEAKEQSLTKDAIARWAQCLSTREQAAAALRGSCEDVDAGAYRLRAVARYEAGK